MTLRARLGSEVGYIQEQIDDLLDREDAARRTDVSSRAGLPRWSSGHRTRGSVRDPPDRIARRACRSRSARSGWLGARRSHSLTRPQVAARRFDDVSHDGQDRGLASLAAFVSK